MPYDPLKDFSSVVQIAASPYLLLVNPDFPAKTWPEFLALVKAQPGIQSGHGTPQLAEYANKPVPRFPSQEPPAVPTRNVVLSEHQHDLVETLVQSGRYQNASEVLREGLRLIEQREQFEAARLEALKEAANQGWAAIAAGDYTDVAEDRIADFIDQLSEQAARLAHTAD